MFTMKKKIVNGFLMLALLVSTMGTFVSCKDYDEDGFIDLRNRISNEASLRETLQKQVANLEASLAQLQALAATHATKQELKDSLAKYVRKEDYLKFVSATDAHFDLLDKAVKDLQNDVDYIKANMATKDDLAAITVLINEANKAASEAKAMAEEAKKMAQEAKDLVEELKKQVEGNTKLIEGLQDQLNKLTERVTTLETTVKTLEETIKVWTERITQINNRIDSINAVMLGYEQRIISLEDLYKDLLIKVNNQGDSISNLYLEIEKLNQKIVELEQNWNLKIEELRVTVIKLSDEAKDIANEALAIANEALITAEAANAKASNAEQLAYHAVAVAEATAAAMEDAIKRAEDAAKRAEDAAKTATEKAAEAEKAKNTCDSILTVIKGMTIGGCSCPKDLEERLAAAELAAKNADAKAETAQKTAEAAQKAAEAAQKAAEDAQKAADDAQKDATKALNDLADLEKRVKWLEDNWSAGSGCTCGDLEKRVKAIEDADLINRMAAVEKEISTIKTTISTLETSVKNLKLDFANMISGVIVQATNNPVLGYLNLPANVKLNMLMTYFGVADQFFAFPAAGDKWVDNSEDFTDSEIKVMTGGMSDFSSVPGYFTQYGDEHFANDKLGDGNVYMGKVYVTVNPNTVNFSGQTFTLENSQGKQSIVTLSPARKSYDLLTFGYDRTRAESNGFYEANAYMPISDKNLDDLRLSLDLEGMKSKVKDAWKNKSKSNFVSLVADVYEAIDNKIEANAVKASWTDSDGKEHGIFSDYGIGIATVKPLSFNTLNLEILKKGLPGKKQINKLISEIINQIKVKCPTITYPDDVIFKNVEAKGNKLVVTFQGTLNGSAQTFTIEFDTASENIKTVDDIVKIIVSDGSGDATIDLAELLNSVNAQLKAGWDSSFAQAKADMIDGLAKYVDKAYNKANSIIHLYALFDINLVAHQDGSGFKFVNEDIDHATKVDGSVRLYPTSNTVELFAPAYKKYIGISNVYKADKTALSQSEAISKAQAAAGDNFNKVIDGDTYVVLNGEKGYIYEVSYAAVDYHGLKTRRKFYVEF